MTQSVPPEIYAGQFVLAREGQSAPPGWGTVSEEGWVLATHPDLPVVPVVDAGGRRLGVVVGHVVVDGRYAPSQIVSTQPWDGDGGDAVAEVLDVVEGRYVLVVLTGRLRRVYVDASAAMGVVYSTTVPAVASTPSLIGGPDHPWDQDLSAALGMPESGLWYPFGLTPKKNVLRLLPNHYLDLDDMTTARHWPGPGFGYGQGDVEPLVREVVDGIATMIAAVGRQRGLHLSLTAGRDSRMLLACARASLDRASLFTFVDEGADTTDALTARALAARLGVRHVELPTCEAAQAELELWQEKTGRCVGGEIWRIHPTLRGLDPERVLMTGMGGEVGRAFYWRTRETARTPLTLSELVDRCRLPAHPRILDSGRAWMSALPTDDTLEILDLLYLEQRLGCWGGPQAYGGDSRHLTTVQMFPLAQRRSVRAMMSLPTTYRREQRLARDVCRVFWPEVASLPFNAPPGRARARGALATGARYALGRAVRARPAAAERRDI